MAVTVDAVAEYRKLWSSQTPDVAAFVESKHTLSTADLVAVLCIDQEFRWRRGDRVPAETYFARFPALRHDPEYGPDLVFHECLLRERIGMPLTSEELASRFPEFAEALTLQLEVHRSVQHETTILADWPSIPGYEILAELGRGGMGVVYRGRHIALDRIVALKLIRDARMSPELIARFRAEATILARTPHPNIVQVHEVGEWMAASGRVLPYIALEYVGGGTLEELARKGPLDSSAAAAIVEQVALGVAAAHRAGVIHRDLKPANVLIARKADASADLLAKVTDFGLAKQLTDSTLSHETEPGIVVGTPAYMSPEQADGRSDLVGPGSDVYGLGAILYELLVGRPPLMGGTALETLKMVLHDDPVPVRRQRPDVPRDLDTIIRKCLEKQPAQRYPSVAMLSEELARFREGRPIEARPLSSATRGWRWCRRNPAVASLLVSLAFVFALGTAGVLWQWQKARDSAQHALEKANEAKQNSEWAAQNAARAILSEQLATQQRYNDRIQGGAELWNIWQPHAFDARLADLVPREGESDLRGFEWRYLKALSRGQALRTWAAHSRQISGLAFTPDGKLIATASPDATIALWDPATGQLVRTIYLLNGVIGISFNWQGDTIMVKNVTPGGSAEKDGRIQVGDRIVGTQDRNGHLTLVAERVRTAECSLAVIGGMGEPLARYHVIQGVTRDIGGPAETLATIQLQKTEAADITTIEVMRQGQRLQDDRFPVRIAFAPDGHTLGVAWGGALRLIDIHTRQVMRLFSSRAQSILSFAWSPRGDRLATIGKSTAGITLQIRKLDGSVLHTFSDRSLQNWHPGVGSDVPTVPFFTPDGKFVGIACGDAFQCYDVESGQLIDHLNSFGHESGFLHSAAPPDGSFIASAGGSNSLTIWDLTRKQPVRWLKGHTASPFALAWSPHHALLASGGADNTVRIWDPHRGLEQAIWRGHRHLITTLAFSPDSKVLVSGDSRGNLFLWDTTAEPGITWRSQALNPVNGVAVAPDGEIITVGATESSFFNSPTTKGDPPAFHPGLGHRAGEIRTWDLQTPAPRNRWQGDGRLFRAIHVRPGSHELVIIRCRDYSDCELTDIDISTGKIHNRMRTDRPTFVSPDGRVHVDFEPRYDGRILPTVLTVRDARTRAIVAVLPGPRGQTEIEFQGNPARLMVTGIQDGTVRYFDCDSWKLLVHAEIGGNPGLAALSSDGKTLLVGRSTITQFSAAQGDLVVWDVEGKKIRRTIPAAHRSFLNRVQFYPDGKRFLTVAVEGIRVWDASTLEPITEFNLPDDAVCKDAGISPDGKTIAVAWMLGFYPTPGAGVILLEASSGRERARTQLVPETAFSWFSFHPDGQEFFTGFSSDRLDAWDATTAIHLRQLSGTKSDAPQMGHATEVMCVAISPDGNTVATGGWDRLVKLWDRRTGTVIATLPGHKATVRALAFTPDGNTLMSGSGGMFGTRVAGEILIWDRSTLKPRFGPIHFPQGVTAMSSSPDGLMLAVGTDRNYSADASIEERRASITLIDLRTGSIAAIWKPENMGRVNALAFAPNGRTLHSAIHHFEKDAPTSSGQALESWDVAAGTLRTQMLVGEARITALVIAPDGKTLATGGVDQPVRLWNADTLDLLLNLPGTTMPVKCLTFTHDGQALIAAGGSFNDGELTVWNASP